MFQTHRNYVGAGLLHASLHLQRQQPGGGHTNQRCAALPGVFIWEGPKLHPSAEVMLHLQVDPPGQI
eukprot:scaffold312602_cov32-Prasinocladus_malaysianus.AAC.1